MLCTPKLFLFWSKGTSLVLWETWKLAVQTADTPGSSGRPCLQVGPRESITRGKFPSHLRETVSMRKSCCVQMLIQKPRCVPNTVDRWLATGQVWKALEGSSIKANTEHHLLCPPMSLPPETPAGSLGTKEPQVEAEHKDDI